MEYAIWPVEELRQEGNVLSGRFPYGKLATMANAGRVRKERIEARAFRFSAESPDRELHLLVGHSYDMPLARKLNGSLVLVDTPEALEFRAALPPENERPTYMVDALLQLRAGLIGGISPRMQVPPATVVPGAERLVPEEGNPGVMIRSIREALLPELSLVSRPAYGDTTVELRELQDAGDGASVDSLVRRARLWL